MLRPSINTSEFDANRESELTERIIELEGKHDKIAKEHLRQLEEERQAPTEVRRQLEEKEKQLQESLEISKEQSEKLKLISHDLHECTDSRTVYEKEIIVLKERELILEKQVEELLLKIEKLTSEKEVEVTRVREEERVYR